MAYLARRAIFIKETFRDNRWGQPDAARMRIMDAVSSRSACKHPIISHTYFFFCTQSTYLICVLFCVCSVFFISNFFCRTSTRDSGPVCSPCSLSGRRQSAHVPTAVTNRSVGSHFTASSSEGSRAIPSL